MQKTASDSKVRKWDGLKAEKCLSQNKRREEQEKDSATKLSSQASKGQFLHMVFMSEYVYYGKQKDSNMFNKGARVMRKPAQMQ